MNNYKSMKMETIVRNFKAKAWRPDNQGVALVIVVVLLVVLIGFMALAIDVGFYMVTRNELQNIADGAALAACRQMGEIYRLMPPEEQPGYVFSPPATVIVNAAIAVGQSNRAGGLQGIAIAASDVIIGQWDGTTLTPTMTQPNAVRVIVRREDPAADYNGPVTTFFARVLGIATMDVQADAIASLTGQSTTVPGELELPVGISNYFFQGDAYCNESIVFNPTNDPASCAGWSSYDISPPNDNLLRDILNETVTSSETTAGETVFNFIGGNLSDPTFDALLLLFMRKGYDVNADGGPVAVDGDGFPVTGPMPDGAAGTVPLYEDGARAYYPDDKTNPTARNQHVWETTVAVYDRDDCSNPNSSITVVGYSKIIITDVHNAPDKRIVGEVVCNRFSSELTRGDGNAVAPLKGSIPNLVE